MYDVQVETNPVDWSSQLSHKHHLPRKTTLYSFHSNYSIVQFHSTPFSLSLKHTHSCITAPKPSWPQSAALSSSQLYSPPSFSSSNSANKPKPAATTRSEPEPFETLTLTAPIPSLLTPAGHGIPISRSPWKNSHAPPITSPLTSSSATEASASSTKLISPPA